MQAGKVSHIVPVSSCSPAEALQSRGYHAMVLCCTSSHASYRWASMYAEGSLIVVSSLMPLSLQLIVPALNISVIVRVYALFCLLQSLPILPSCLHTCSQHIAF